MEWIKAIGIVVLYFVLFFLFGSMVTFRKEKICPSFSMTLLVGFFMYYILFQIITVPLMFSIQPLNRLSVVWSIVAVIVCVLSIWKNHEKWKRLWDEKIQYYKVTKTNLLWWFAIGGVTLVNVLIVSAIYSSYWDATYYVGNVSYAVYYNSINTINPLHGSVMEYFDLKHCLATYHVHDAVFCQLFQIHPLIETKTIMVIVVTILLNLVYYQFAQFFFTETVWKRAWMMAFCLLINLCTYTAYTASSFVLLRTYEGKAIAGAIIAPMLFYWFLQLFLKKENNTFAWIGLFITSWGAAAISSSALFLVLAGISCFMIIYWIQIRRWSIIINSVICMMPSAIVLGCYLLNRIGWLSVPIGR